MAAMKALSHPLIEGPHKGFLRSDALLGVVLLTDEDDQSITTLQVKYGAQFLVLGDIRNGFVYDSVANTILISSAIDFSKLPIADLEITFKRE